MSHGRYNPDPRQLTEWRDRLERQARVSRALQDRRAEAKHEPAWVTRAKSNSLPAKEYQR